MDGDDLALLLAPWQGMGPTYLAVAEGIRALVLDGRLAAGTRLPTERALAAALGTSRSTVTAAYDQLRGAGWARSAGRSGTRTAVPAPPPEVPDVPDRGRPPRWDLTVAALPAPPALLGAAAAAAEDLAGHLGHHGLHPLGLPVLRAAVAARNGALGMPTREDQVLVTSGALHGWSLILDALTRPGDRVAVEQPTYPATIDAVRARRCRPVPIPVDAEHRGGTWGTTQVAGARLALVTPDGHNPTGAFASGSARRRLLAELARAGVEVVVSDETFADLALEGQPRMLLAGPAPTVVTLGSMSKSHWAGLRVGWVRAPRPLIDRLVAVRAATDLAGPVFEQLVAARLLSAGDAIVEQRRRLLRANCEALVAALRDHTSWEVTPPAAGMALWPRVGPPGATRIAVAAAELGVRIRPGPRFTIDGSADHRVRLPLSIPAASAVDVARALDAAHERAVLARLSRRPVAAAAGGGWTA